MDDSNRFLRKGQRVEIANKNVRGKIAYIGMTSFAVGKWIGVILDEPKGKNNGTIKGTTYFTCDESYGMFVRPTQLIFLDDSDNPMEDVSSPDEKPKSRQSSSGSVRSLAHSMPQTTPVAARPTTVRRKSPVKQISTIRSQITPSSSSSRLSLSGSRQSLTGSRSQLVSPAEKPATSASTSGNDKEKSEIPKPTKTSMSPPETNQQVSKRASFIETGFLETLKPQFTPGQSLTSPSPVVSAEDKFHAMKLQQENEDLQAQVKDLQEKLETLKLRRADDKERLREFDKMKTQFEQLQEFKSKIMDSHSQLQRELQRAKQEAKDAIDARDFHAEEMAELAESVELITLDKEMAEEKADTLQIELDNARERIDELTLDLEILKTEMQDTMGTGTTGVSTYELKQMEQQNVRLRETLVRMRDHSAQEKHEIQKLQKELETKKSEVTELQKIKEKLSSRVDELEAQIVDLQEQVDAALGAEEMVEQLAERKMELEEKVKSLEEEVAELEALEEVHEQLVESNHELEMDLREELDMAHAAKRETIREKEAALETILDRDQTILKFRELVQRLNEQCQELRDKINKESSSSRIESIPEAIDFKQVFAETKAYTRAIDLQLRQIELTQANEMVKYLLAFMPETFHVRGGDHDGISVNLLISRIVFKAGVIVTQMRERFRAPEATIERTAVLQDHVVHQFAFRSRLLHNIHNMQSIMHQFLYGLTICTPEVLLKIGASLPEMIAQEKVIDHIIDLLKLNQMDENSNIHELEKCVAFFNAMYSVLLANEGLMNETLIVRDCTAAISAACDSIETDSAIIRSLIQGGDETSDSGLLIQFVIQNVEQMKQQIKLIKRRLPQDPSITKCHLAPKTIQNLKQIVENMNKVMNLLQLAAKCTVQYVNSEATNDPGTVSHTSISHTKLWELLSNLCEKIYEQEDRGVSQNLRNVLSSSNTDMSQLAQYLLDHEYEIMSVTQAAKEKPSPPILVRAQSVKKQLEETKMLTATLENKEAEIRQLKLNAKLKQNELSEMQIRKDLAEKKLSVLQQDHESNFTKLQRQYDEVMAELKKKEKEFEETMDHLQSDIDSLESERGALREKLKVYSNKKGDLKTTTALDITASSPHIAQELELLKKALLNEREERMRIQANEYQKVLKNLKPIHVPKVKDEKIDQLENELHKVKYEWLMSLVTGAEIPATRTKHSNWTKSLEDHQKKQKEIRNEIKMKAECLANEVVNEYFDRKPYRSVHGDFAKFPSTELSQALKENRNI